MSTLAQTLARWSAHLAFAAIPPEVVADIRLRILDSLGIQLASHTLPSTRAAISLVQRWGGRPEASIPGLAERLPAPAAALAAGVMAHSFDFDDTHSPTLIHISACMVPAVLAVGERAGLSGQELITCAAAGYEVALNLGLASPGKFHDHGLHSTSIFGTFGAAAAAARALRLSEEQTVWAFGIAGSQAAGLLQSLVDGTWAKLFNCGWAAHSGLVAAELAALGFTGPPAVFEGRFGVYPAHLRPDEFDLTRATAGLGQTWQTPGISFKLYPACHHLHSFLDAVADLKQRHAVDPAAITEVVCLVAPEQVQIICEPWVEKLQPTTEYSARFSLPYAIAAGFCLPDQGVDAYTPDLAREPHLAALASKVRYELRPSPDFPRVLPADIRVTLADGRSLTASRRNCRGPYGDPIRAADIERKFRANAGRLLPASRVEAIIDAVAELEQLDSVGRLLDLCRPEGGFAA